MAYTGIPRLKDYLFMKRNPVKEDLRRNYYLDNLRGKRYQTNIFNGNNCSRSFSWKEFGQGIFEAALGIGANYAAGKANQAGTMACNGSSAVNSIFTVAGYLPW